MIHALFITSRRDDVRDLFYKTRGVWKVSGASDPANSLLQVMEGGYDLVILDLAMTGLYAPDLLVYINALPEHPPVFIMSREYSFRFLEFSCKYGVAGYFHMPCSVRTLFTAVDRFFAASRRLSADSADCVAEPRESAETTSAMIPISRVILGDSRQMEALRRTIVNLRNRKEPVLITGETGTGKDLVARLIHRFSPVSSGPYSAFNASCIPPALAESLLFGAKRGSYTDAADSPGLFESADRGTLFLDEIGELDISLQPKFLRVLEDKTVTRLGSSRSRAVDFRLLCATNRKLSVAVSEGRFRQDLFHRIDVLRVTIPPLREHPDDIPVLAASVLPGFGKTLSVGALDKLQRHAWPGNVRDLFNCLERTACNCEHDVIQPDQILF